MSKETNPMSVSLQEREHYPYVTRSLIRLFQEGRLDNVAGVVVEPEYGYASRITYVDGSHRITYGNDLGLNPGSSCDLAKDKGHSKFMLKAMGITCPEGEEFLLPWWADKISPSQIKRGNTLIKGIDQADDYIDKSIGYPVYVKPVSGSKGSDIFLVNNSNELAEIFASYEEKRIPVAIVEQPILMPDYRVVTLDGELISAYQRVPLKVIGDGISDITSLVDATQERFDMEGRDTMIDAADERITRYLGSKGIDLQYIPDKNEEVTLLPMSNLSMGGISEDVSESINERWTRLASDVAKNFNLRLIGLDLACSNIESPESDYCVLEVNAAPGLDHYACSGDKQRKLVDDMYVRVFNTFSR